MWSYSRWAQSSCDARRQWDRQKLTGFEVGGVSFIHLAKCCCLMATSSKIGSVLQDREVDSKQPVTVPHKTLQL